MRKRTTFAILTVACLASGAFGQDIVVNRGESFEPKIAVVPFAFTTRTSSSAADPPSSATASCRSR